MVPLESILRKPARKSDAIQVPPPRPPRAPAPAKPRSARMFKVIDVRSREVLAEHANARATIEVLNGARSIVDVSVHVWMPATERWRLLTFDEQRLLWSRREPAPATPAAGATLSDSKTTH